MKNNNPIFTVFSSIIMAACTIYLAILSWNAIKAHDYIGVSEEQRHSIHVNGEGEVVAIPDIAKLQLGHSIEKKTVAIAQKENTQTMNKIIGKLKKDFNIDKKDIQTSSYNIYPQYDWDEGKRILRGYEVRQNLNIKVRDLEKLALILEAGARAGLNQVGGLSFEIDDPEALKQVARVKALENAKEKAEALSKVAGVKLGKIISFSESIRQPIPKPMYRSYESVEAIGIGGAAPEIEAGSTEIKIIATVEYEIL